MMASCLVSLSPRRSFVVQSFCILLLSASLGAQDTTPPSKAPPAETAPVSTAAPTQPACPPCTQAQQDAEYQQIIQLYQKEVNDARNTATLAMSSGCASSSRARFDSARARVSASERFIAGAANTPLSRVAENTRSARQSRTMESR